MHHLLKTAGLIGISAVLSATAFAQTVPAASTAASTVLKPPAALKLENVPPVDQNIVGKVQAWRDIRGVGVVGWHPTKDELLVRMRHQNTAQVFTLSSPKGQPQLLTDFPEPVSFALYQPKTANYVLFGKDQGGNEVTQLFRMDLPSKQVTQITPDGMRHQFAGYNRARTHIAYGSVPLNASIGTMLTGRIEVKLTLVDPLKPQEARVIATLPDAGWSGLDWAADDQSAIMTKYLSAGSSEVYRLDVKSGQVTKLLPLPGMAPASMSVVAQTPDGKGMFMVSDHDGEFQNLHYFDFASKTFTNLTKDIPWDVVGSSVNEDRTRMVISINEDGRSTIRVVDPVTKKVTPLIEPLPRGSIGGISFARHADEMAFTVNSAQTPGDVFTYNFKTNTLRNWANAQTGSVDTSGLSDMQIIRWKSFDDRTISGLILKPPASRFKGPRPVIIDIHGGPEAQSVVRFAGSDNYVINEMGIVKIWPNVRGSRGYGKTFLTLDDGRKREDSVRDIGALLDWIKTQPDLDASRVSVEGGSYGGYMSLAVSTNYADRIAGAIDSVGISHFVTFLERTERYRVDLRRVEYGDERDPQMREFLHNISPLTNAHKIKKPLFVVQGRNDPRVPWQEAEQIVQKVRANNVPVWYMLAENEGHGFGKKENADYYFYSKLKFYEQVLLK